MFRAGSRIPGARYHTRTSGLPIDLPPFQLIPPLEPVTIVTGPHIGISKAIDMPWRFGFAGSSFVVGRSVEIALPTNKLSSTNGQH